MPMGRVVAWLLLLLLWPCQALLHVGRGPVSDLALLTKFKLRDSNLMLITDESSQLEDLPQIADMARSFRVSKLRGEDRLQDDGLIKVICVLVQHSNVKKVLSLIAETVQRNQTFIHPGLWRKKNTVLFFIREEKTTNVVLNDQYIKTHPRLILVIKHNNYWKLLLSPANGPSLFYVTITDFNNANISYSLEDLHSSQNGLQNKHLRVGGLIFSHHLRANIVQKNGRMSYTDLWGYEVLMMEEMARRYKFTWECIVPEDGAWGLINSEGLWTGLVRQAAFNEVDVSISSVMNTRDRSLVTDNPVPFDAEYMLFVSPLPAPYPKWTALVRPFDNFVWIASVSSVLIFALGLVILSKLAEKITGESGGNWNNYDNCAWFSFATFIGESVMRYESKIRKDVLKIIIVTWYMYSMIMLASYAGNLRSFFINPGEQAPIDQLEEILESGLPWGLSFYGEEEETYLAESKDPILSKIWKGKKVYPLDEQYAMLEEVVAGQLVFIDYINGIFPQMQVKYKKGGKPMIHIASHRWTKFSRTGWCFHKFFAYTEMFEKFLSRCYEAGLVYAYQSRTWAGMRQEWLRSDTEKNEVVDYAELKKKATPLYMTDLQGSFYLMGFGILISLVVYIFTIITKRPNKKNLTNLRQHNQKNAKVMKESNRVISLNNK